MARSYNESDIDYHSGLKGIRAKPAMYLGPMDSDGLFTILREIADNTADECAAGRNNFCGIICEPKGFTVWDEGEGIPVGKKTIVEHGVKSVISTLTLLLTRTHAGGKFRGEGAYAETSGTHGVGGKAVNAVSSSFEVWTCRDKKWWYTSFAKGEEVEPVQLSTAPSVGRKKLTCGTMVKVVPDMTLFQKGSVLDHSLVHSWARITSFMHPGFTVQVDATTKETYCKENGVAEYLDERIAELEVTPVGKPCVVTNYGLQDCDVSKLGEEERTGSVDVALSFTDMEGQAVDFYTNGVHNSAGGKHADAMWSALTKVLPQFGNTRTNFNVADLREGVVGIVNYRIARPQFSGQTKEKLSDVRVPRSAFLMFSAMFESFFSKNKAMAKELCNRATALRAMRDEASQKRKTLLSLKVSSKTAGKGILPGKFAGCSAKTKAQDRELYIVEGDSAGGSAKQARMKDYQCVLPLKGKPLNAFKHPDSKVLASVEVANILTCIGYNPALKDPMANLSVGKIIIMSDSDVDGYHITSLVLGLLYLYLPELFDRGIVYALDSHGCKFFCRGVKQDYYFGSTPKSIEAAVAKNKDRVVGKSSYLKGWGELNAEGLRIAAMDPDTRTLIQLGKMTKKQSVEYGLLMGENVAYRKEMFGVL